MNVSVAIILVNWNSFDTTSDCIRSLLQVSYPHYHIIVVDNASADGSGNRLKQEYPGIILIQSPANLGFAGGNNLGLRYALQNGYAYSFMLNNDTFVEPGFLEPLLQYMEEHPQTGAIQPRIFFNHNRSLLWNGGSYFNKILGYTYTRGYNRLPTAATNHIKEVDWITGCAFLISNPFLKKTGVLSCNMFMYSEDVDLSFRIRQLGYRLVYHPASTIYHIAGMSYRNDPTNKEGVITPQVHYYNQRNRLWILRKYTPWYFIPSVLIFNFFYVTMIIGYFAARGRSGKLKAMLKAVKDGLTGSIRYDEHGFL